MNNESELVVALQHIVTLCGYYPLNENEIDVLVKSINKDEPTLTGPKLKEMFELAIRDKLGIELKGRLSVKEYFRVKFAWDRSFKNEQIILEAKKPTKEELIKFHKDWLENCVFIGISKFFKTGDYKITDYGNVLYNYLNRTGLITFSKEVEEKFRLQVKKVYGNKLSNSNEPQTIKTIIDQSDKFTSIGYKNYALEQFLRTCRQENRDIIGEIKNHEQKHEYAESEKSFK